MNATPSTKSPRSWAADISRASNAPAPVVSCSCGLEVQVRESLEELAAKLANVGWRVSDDGRALCPECASGVHRRVVNGSKGARYVLRHVAGAWRCSCPGYTYRNRCKHSDALEAETLAVEESSPAVCASCDRERGDIVNDVCGGCSVEVRERAEMEAAWLGVEAGQ